MFLTLTVADTFGDHRNHSMVAEIKNILVFIMFTYTLEHIILEENVIRTQLLVQQSITVK